MTEFAVFYSCHMFCVDPPVFPEKSVCVNAAAADAAVMFRSCHRLQVPGSSTTGSSCCSVGRLLWLARLPTFPTSQELPSLWNWTPPAIDTHLSRNRASTRRTTQVNTSVMSWNPSCVCALINSTVFSFQDEAQFEMDIWRERNEALS